MPIQIVGTPAAHVTFSCSKSSSRLAGRTSAARGRRSSRRASSPGTGSPTRSRGTSARPAGTCPPRPATAGPSGRCRTEGVCSIVERVRVDDALRPAGRAARVAHRARPRRSSTRSACPTRRPIELLEHASVPSTTTTRLLGVPGDRRDARGRRRADVLGACAEHEAAARDAEVALHVLVVVPAERRDAVAALEPEPVERDGELLRAAHQSR